MRLSFETWWLSQAVLMCGWAAVVIEALALKRWRWLVIGSLLSIWAFSALAR